MGSPTIFLYLLLAAAISFLCSLTALMKLQKMTLPSLKFVAPPHKSPKPHHPTFASPKLNCTNWLVFQNPTKAQTKDYFPLLHQPNWCKIIIASDQHDAESLKNCTTCAIFIARPENSFDDFATKTIWPLDYALRHDAQVLALIKFEFGAEIYLNALREIHQDRGRGIEARVVLENATDGAVFLQRYPPIQSDGKSIRYQLYENSKEPAIQAFFTSASRHQPTTILGRHVYLNPAGPMTYDVNGFWALIPFKDSTVHGLWTQRLLQETDQRLVLVPLDPKSTLKSIQLQPSDHSGAADRYQSIAKFLDSWQCPEDLTFFECILQLTREMATRRLITLEDAKLVQIWIDHLIRMGYRFSDRSFSPDQSIGRTVNFHPNAIRPGKEESIRKLSEFCQAPFQSSNAVRPSHYENVILVITFNHPHHSNIPLLLTLYGRWFSHVIFCSTFNDEDPKQSIFASQHFGTWSLGNISYINVSRQEWFQGVFSYTCLSHVIKLNLRNTDGYLVMGDDVLLNFWNLVDLSAPRMHFGSCETVMDFPSLWWFSDYGDTAVRKVRALLPDAPPLSNRTSEILKRVLLLPQWCASDIYYVPIRHTREYRIMADVFHKAESFLEIAVPKMMAALGSVEQYMMIGVEGKSDQLQREWDIRGKYLWKNRDRSRAIDFFDPKAHFIHPFKFSRLNETRWKGGFCQRYVSSLVDMVTS